MKKQAAIVFCAHSDDQIIGPGGTMAKYAANGYDITTVIFSYGESSHPWLKRRITADIREQEARDADKVIGGKGVLFLGISEADFIKQAASDWVKEKLEHITRQHKPTKVFMHSIDDPHPAHRAVHKAVTSCLDNMNYRCEAYAFDVWNLWNLSGRNDPKMYVDISGTFNEKLKALDQFRSQWMTMITLKWSIYLRAIINGFDAKCKYAERFYKVR